MPTPRTLLEHYLQAKDLTQPHLMQEIYAPDAVLTFSIATDTISFPERTVGVDGITKTLVVDFAKTFNRCKTFYVCESPPQDDSTLACVPWLVLMREHAAARLRIGKGYYVWRFAQRATPATRVTAMHIHIDRMDAIADSDGSLLASAQAVLPYPWLKPSVLHRAFQRLAEGNLALAFLDDFQTPLDPPVCQ